MSSALTTPNSPTPLLPKSTSEATAVDPLDVLESALRDAFSFLMTLLDEEDAVLLYRCRRLAEASPLLLESCDQRRSAIEEGIAEQCERLWQAARVRLVDSIEQIRSTSVEAAKSEASKHFRAEVEERLEAARTAAAVRQQQFQIEKESSVREALRRRAEEDASTLAAAERLLREEAEAHRLRANRLIAESRGAMQVDIAKADARAAAAEAKAAAATDKFASLEENVERLASRVGETSKQRDEAEAQLERIEARLMYEMSLRQTAEAQAEQAEAMRLQAERCVEKAREEALNAPELLALQARVIDLEAEIAQAKKANAEYARKWEELDKKQSEFKRRAESAERELMRLRESGDELQAQLTRAELALKEPPPVLPVARTMSAKQVQKMASLSSADAIQADAAAVLEVRQSVIEDELSKKSAKRAASPSKGGVAFEDGSGGSPTAKSSAVQKWQLGGKLAGVKSLELNMKTLVSKLLQEQQEKATIEAELAQSLASRDALEKTLEEAIASLATPLDEVQSTLRQVLPAPGESSVSAASSVPSQVEVEALREQVRQLDAALSQAKSAKASGGGGGGGGGRVEGGGDGEDGDGGGVKKHALLSNKWKMVLPQVSSGLTDRFLALQKDFFDAQKALETALSEKESAQQEARKAVAHADAMRLDAQESGGMAQTAYHAIWSRAIQDAEMAQVQASIEAERKVKREAAQLKLVFAMRVQRAAGGLVKAKEAEMEAIIERVVSQAAVEAQRMAAIVQALQQQVDDSQAPLMTSDDL